MLKLLTLHNMNIVIIGTGYVGLVTGVGLASRGNVVNFIDLDDNKIKSENIVEEDRSKLKQLSKNLQRIKKTLIDWLNN